MARKKTQTAAHKEIIREMDEQAVLRENYMPYAMSVITDRALPAIDGFKPSQRRVLYTMYNMGLLTGGRTKSANVAGAGMKLHPHGDCLAADTVFYGLSGERKTIKELYDEGVENFEVLSVTAEEEIIPAVATGFRIGQITREIYDVGLSNGGTVKCTANHPFLIHAETGTEWVKADSLKVGQRLFAVAMCESGDTEETHDADCETITISDITIKSCEPTPMYDFTVRGVENAFILPGGESFVGGRALVCVHNSSIYSTAVRLTQNNESLLMPFIDGKGNFGKKYSSTIEEAASRYTEMKLMPICSEIFPEIKEGAVDMVDNYDGTMKEPSLLPCAFPNILVSANMGIAVGMACNFPGFNFGETCRATAEYIKHPKTDILDIMPAPDFTTGGELLYDKDEMREIYRTGLGSFQVRGTYEYDEKNRIILIRQIPYSTSIEAIVAKIGQLMKDGKLPEVSDVRDESDLSGLKIALDVRKEYKDKVKDVMAYMFEATPLTDSFACNFNLLVAGTPKVLGVKQIMDEWIFEREIEKREVLTHRRQALSDRLHLLEGLEKILLDIDKAVKIVRKSENDEKAKEAMRKAFSLDDVQAEFVLNIRLRNFNREYILNHTKDIESLKKDIEKIDKVLGSEKGIRNLIAKELLTLAEKYPSPRKTVLVEKAAVQTEVKRETEPGFFTISEDGYIGRAKTGIPITEDGEILIFTDNALCYKLNLPDIPEKEVYIGSAVKVAPGEKVMSYFCLNKDRFVLTVYEDGNVSVYPLTEFETLQNRRCIKNAYSSHSPALNVFCVRGDETLVLKSGKKTESVAVSELRPQGKGSRGRRILKPKAGDTLEVRLDRPHKEKDCRAEKEEE